MELTHTFTVPATIEETWSAFNDIESVAGCFPGATVGSVEEDTFTGSVKVKLGPIALVYNGTGTFTEKDEVAHRMVIEAKGKDKRGNGTAGAHVVARLEAAGASTNVEVVTDLSITGKPAQFGRGVIQDVSDKLLGQFVGCLEQKLGAAPEPLTASAPGTEPGTAPGAGATASTSPPRADAADAIPAPPRETAAQHRADEDALDLGATVLPVLVKGYWKQGLALLLGVAVLIRIVRRLSR